MTTLLPAPRPSRRRDARRAPLARRLARVCALAAGLVLAAPLALSAAAAADRTAPARTAATGDDPGALTASLYAVSLYTAADAGGPPLLPPPARVAPADAGVPADALDDGAARPDEDGAARPGVAVLSSDEGHDTGLTDGTFTVTATLWWGENGDRFRLYRDGVLVDSVPLTASSPRAQVVSVPVTGLPDDTYTFTGELENAHGVTATTPLTVRVTDASPGVPQLSVADQAHDGSYTLTASLWWGTNATAYRFLEDGVVVGAGTLTARTPSAQHASVRLTGKAPGSYVYTVELLNAAGATSSTPLVVDVGR
ncbi:hypothetical protein [Puerhibacterium sp. TATVAM-FAB25]|uniref:hypothetical protein n=1 Tax=Puerhibacterium sp. TATVAM-FAB25 TaxID=3093699 RepID=UPI00397DAC96